MSTAILQPNLNEFELYLEGIKVPTFKSIQISEAEEEVPAAAIDFVFNSEILKILPGTIVQIFCKRTYKNESKTILLFEGEVTTVSFNFSSSIGRVISLKASSILFKMFKARMRPSNSIIKQEQWDAELLVSQKFKITTDNKSKDEEILISRQTDVYTDTGELTIKDKNKTDNSMIVNPDESSNQKEAISGNFKNLRNEPDIQNFLQKISQELVPSNNRPGSKGNFNFLLQYFNNEFQKNDIIYGLNAIGFKIGPSLLAFPNPGKAKAYHLAIFQKAMNSYLQDLNSNPLANQQDYNLIEVLQILKQNLHYKYLIPASPFFVTPLNTDNFGTQKIPIRLLLLPDFESGPPIKCNVFFPEQVDNFNFQRDYINEATRLIASMDYSNVKGMEKIPEYLNPIHVIPDVDITQEKDKSGKITVSSKLLFEETYRGVTLRATQYDASYIKALQDQESGKEKKKSKADSGALTIKNAKETDNSYINTTAKAEDQIGEMIRIHAMQDFSTLKYGQRMASFTTQWSPYRIVGLPATAMFLDDLNVVGIIRSIQTSISSIGASSSITLKNVRLVYDKTTDFKKTITTGDFEKSPRDHEPFINNYKIEDNYLEGLMGANPIAFNKDVYAFHKIGRTLYQYLTNGEVTSTLIIASKNALEEFKGIAAAFQHDSSILDGITRPDTDPTKKGIDFENYEYLKKAIEALKNSSKDAEDKFSFQENYNKRDSVITKKQYLDYLGIDSLEKVEQVPNLYCKHLFKILSKEKVSDSAVLSKLNEKNGLKQLEKLNEFKIDYGTSDVSDEKAVYRIYNANRMAHVLNLKKYII